MAGTFETLRLMVQPAHCDHLGHVNVSQYMGWSADAAFSLMSELGFDRTQAEADGACIVAARCEIEFLREIRPGDVVAMTTGVADLSERRVLWQHRLRIVGSDIEAMRSRLQTACIDAVSRRARPLPRALTERLARVERLSA